METLRLFIKPVLVISFVFASLGSLAKPSPKKHDKHHYKASYYHRMFDGKKTALGQKFSNKGLTMATSIKAFLGKHLVVRSIDTGKKLRLYCNDLMNPRMKGKVDFDLTQRAMKELSGKHKLPGHILINIES